MALQQHDQSIQSVVFHDTKMIIEAYLQEKCDLSDFLIDLRANCLEHDIAFSNKFFKVYPNENVLYENMVSIIRQDMIHLVDMMPLIDEYIDYVFVFRQG